MKNTEYQIKRRVKIEEELSTLSPLPELAKKINTSEGFYEQFLIMKKLYPTQRKAYEVLEIYHTQIFGKRKYSEFDSFRRVAERK